MQEALLVTRDLPLSRRHTLVRLPLVFSDSVLCGQGCCHGVQPLECHFLRLAEIDPVELAFALVVGAPVPAPTLIARLLFVRSEGPERTAKGEGARCTQPGIPIWRSHRQPAILSAPLIDQGIILHHRHSLLIFIINSF